jgi:hypothetical protein
VASIQREENMGHKSKLGLLEIHGLVIPVAWDEEGNPISVAVATFDEDEYTVERDEKGDHLFGLLRREVEVRGEVWIRDGAKTIRVQKYVLIKKPELSEGTSKEEGRNHTRENSVPSR